MMMMVVVENHYDDDHGHDHQNLLQLKLNLMQLMQLATTQQKSRNFTQLTQLVGVHQCLLIDRPAPS